MLVSKRWFRLSSNLRSSCTYRFPHIKFRDSWRYSSFFTGYAKCHALRPIGSKYSSAFLFNWVYYLITWICTKLICGIYIFHYVWSSLEIMYIVLIALLLENIKLFYSLLFFVCLYLEILALSNFFKCIIATKGSESQV